MFQLYLRRTKIAYRKGAFFFALGPKQMLTRWTDQPFARFPDINTNTP